MITQGRHETRCLLLRSLLAKNDINEVCESITGRAQGRI